MAVTFLGTARSTITLGSDATTQNLFTVENGFASRVNVNIRRLAMQCDAIAVVTNVMPAVRTSRASAISGGLILDKTSFDTTQTSDANVIFRAQFYETARITATPGDTAWQQFGVRQHTLAEQQLGNDSNMLPLLVADAGKEFKLRPGQALLCRVANPQAASNAIGTNNWFVECVFEEDAISTFAISGQVTLSATPIVGAKVYVVECDDLQLANPVFVEVVTTNGSGNWSSTIKTGKIGTAFVQYETGGLLYNAPGAPFLQP